MLLALDQDQVAGHPQVHDQGLLAVERQQQVLAAPAQRLDRPPRHRRLQLRRRRPAGTSARRAPPAARSAALRSRARAGGRRSRPRAARASPGSIRSRSRSSAVEATGTTVGGDLGGRAGVRLEVDLLEALAGEVRVHLRGRDVGVAEHLLHGAQVAAARQQVGGEAVAQRVRAHLAAEAGGAGVALDDLVEALAAERAAAEVDEQLRLVALADQLRPAAAQVGGDRRDRLAAERDEPLLRALAAGAQEALAQVEVAPARARSSPRRAARTRTSPRAGRGRAASSARRRAARRAASAPRRS